MLFLFLLRGVEQWQACQFHTLAVGGSSPPPASSSHDIVKTRLLEYCIMKSSNKLLSYELRRAVTVANKNFHFNFRKLKLGKEFQALTVEQVGVLNEIKKNPGVNQTDMAKAVCVERSYMGLLLTKLENCNLVVRQQYAPDKRKRHVYISPIGEYVLNEAFNILKKREQRIIDDWRQEDINIFFHLLEQFSNFTK